MDRLQRLLEKANTLPLCPGVYIMRDKWGKVIYVGKSRKLKNRVSQYFQSGEKNLKTAKMVSLVEDFEYFLESRCFPRGRDYMKDILRDMGLDSYDPLAIIEKTKGRMAEDKQWIRLKYYRPE